MFKTLKKAGILGINRRVGQFILPSNPRRYYPQVDNKILTHKLAQEHHIAQPEIYFTVTSTGQLRTLYEKLKNLDSFVIKPNRGAMGNGILLVHKIHLLEKEESERPRLLFETSRGNLRLADIKYHISDILSGLYSLNAMPDEVIIQQKLLLHSCLTDYAYKGIPDIRIIIFKGFPVMAMLRLPTKESRGRANLHQGAVGLGLNIKNGEVTGAVLQDHWIHTHPDTGHHFKDLSLPQWDRILALSSRCYELTHMGYIGVDLVLDKNQGPLLLEINARPGLSIQIANRTGLTPRLHYISLLSENLSIQEKIDLIKANPLFDSPNIDKAFLKN